MNPFNPHKEAGMKVKVISVFRDKFMGQFYNPGEVIEVSDESRVQDMENRKLAERMKEVEAKRDGKPSKSKE